MEREDPDVDIFNINQNVQDTVIHLEVDEEQWRKITKGSKRQATLLKCSFFGLATNMLNVRNNNHKVTN